MEWGDSGVNKLANTILFDHIVIKINLYTIIKWNCIKFYAQ